MKEKVEEEIFKFCDDRDWGQFHTPENLAKAVVIEASELLECFQWSSDFDQEKTESELADVFIYCILMARALDVDINEIIQNKLKRNDEKYPISKSKGNSKKYDKL